MIKINKGVCSMDNHDWEHILDWKEDYGLLHSFKNELEIAGLNIDSVNSIELKSNQSRYLEVYLKLKREIKEYNYDKLDRLYEELRNVSYELLPYYDIDKIKSYSVYVWSKTTDDFEENLFDIEPDDITFYNKEHKIIKDALPIIEKIQFKLREIDDLYNNKI